MKPALEKMAPIGVVCLALAGCDPKPEAADPSRTKNETNAPATRAVHARDALEDEAWCMELQRLPALEKHLGKATTTERADLKPADDQCAYHGSEGTLEMGIVAVAESAAVAEVLFDALTAGPPGEGATPAGIAALRAERQKTFGARLEKAGPEDTEFARKQLDDMIGQALYVGKTYEDVQGFAEQAAIQTQHSEILDFAVRYLYLREGNTILMFLTRPQGEHAPWPDAYRRLRAAVPEVLEHVRRTRGA